VTDGRGPDQPIVSNKTPEGRARNRRVDILLPRID
jgi:type VI secretion system protein ImpK